MYLGNDFGVYRTTKSDESRARLNNGMPFIPVSGTLWIDLPANASDSYTLTLRSVNGQEVASQTVYASGLKQRTNMDVSRLEPGWYQLVLKGSREVQTGRVMIVR